VFIFARGSDEDCGLRYCGSYWAAINPDGRLAAGIYNSKTGETIVDGWVETGRRSFDRDVVLELALAGNKISATAWHADGRKPTRPQYTFTDSRFASGNVGLGEKVYVGTAAAEFRYFQVIPVLAGDFSGDGVLDASDVNVLGQQIAAATNDASHDLTGDSLVNSDDLGFWVKDVKKTWYGDANLDGEFNSGDLVSVLQAGTFAANLPAGWHQGDWNGDARFDRSDIIVALQDGGYGHGPLAAVQPNGSAGDGQTSIIYNAGNGQLSVDAPAGVELTSINIDSAAGIFTGESALNMGGSFDNDANANIFKATFGGSFGSLSFGNVAQTGLSEEFVAGDLSVVGSLAGGGDLGNVDLVYVPEPSTIGLFGFGLLACLLKIRRTRV
jgi:hypothetical protein